jgi:hypothetical protein
MSILDRQKVKTINQIYFDKTIDELKRIKPYWAVREKIDQLLDKNLHPCVGRYEIVMMKTKTLVKIADFGEVDLERLFTGNSLNDGRINQILNDWNNEKYIDPPTLSISAATNKITFEDGRHRTKASYFLCFDEIPVAIDKEDLDKIRTAANIL